MTASTEAQLIEASAPVPTRGTFDSAADSIFYRRTLVSRDAAGRAAVPSDGDGLPVLGVSDATYNNSTGSEPGGAAGDLAINVKYGNYACFIDGDTPLVHDVVYVVDNVTVSLDPLSAAGAQRGRAGVVTEVRTISGSVRAFVLIGPGRPLLVSAMLQHQSVPIDQLPVFVDGVSNGFDVAVFGFRMNPTIDDEPMTAAVSLPADLDVSRDLVVRCRAEITSVATDDDVVMKLVARFDGGDDEAPVSATVLTVAAQIIEFVIPAADVPVGARALYLSLRAEDTLDTADAIVTALEVEYARGA